jgi:hypothetical protein
MHRAGWKHDDLAGTRRTHAAALQIANYAVTHEVRLIGACVPMRYEEPGARLERSIEA